MTETTTTHPVIAEWAAHWRSFYDLSGAAGCASPDRSHKADDGGSPGATMLASVMEATIEAVEYAADEWQTADEIDDAMADRFHEIADNGPDVYNHTRWQEFTDLAAWQEEPETGEWPEDLTQAAGWALYQIAERLARAMVDDLRERWEEHDAEAWEDDDDA